MSRPEPADESKIIDLRQLGALIDPKGSVRPAPRAAESAVALPTFGANQLRAPRPLVTPPPPPIRPPLPPPPTVTSARGESNVLMVMICGLTLVVLGLTFFIVLTDPPTTVVEQAPAVATMQPMAPSVKDADLAVAAARDEQEDEPEDAVAPNDEPLDEAAEPTEAVEPESTVDAKHDARRSGDRRDRTREPKSSNDTPPWETKAPKDPPKPKDDGGKPTKSDAADLPAECIIDPASCGLGKTPPKSDPKPEAKPAAKLPEKLTAAQIRDGVAKVKAKAKACGAKHGGKAGEKVDVKLTIQGSSGRVTNASPVAPYEGTPLGGCVAGALKGATFDPFGASVQGVQYGIRL